MKTDFIASPERNAADIPTTACCTQPADASPCCAPATQTVCEEVCCAQPADGTACCGS